MRYWGPINSPGGIYGNDGYIDGTKPPPGGDPNARIVGSKVTFRTYEQIMRELTNFVIKSSLTPNEVMDGIQVAQAVQNGKVIYAEDTGNPDRLVVTLDPVPLAIIPGMKLKIKVKWDNWTRNVNLTVNTAAGWVTRDVIFAGGGQLYVRTLGPDLHAIFIFDGERWRLINLNVRIINILAQSAGTNTVIYDSGSGYFNVPPEVYFLHDVEVMGAGGGGGGGGTAANAGAGGNGGNYVRGSMAVIPGQAISYSIGVGGYGGSAAYDGGGGGDTYFGTWRATGGSGGKSDSNPGANNPGSIGGSVHITGQQGDGGRRFAGSFTQSWGGVGGDCAGGGMGGNGAVNGGTTGNPGLPPGGGGGGGTGGTYTVGGYGANGRVLIRY